MLVCRPIRCTEGLGCMKLGQGMLLCSWVRGQGGGDGASSSQATESVRQLQPLLPGS